MKSEFEAGELQMDSRRRRFFGLINANPTLNDVSGDCEGNKKEEVEG